MCRSDNVVSYLPMILAICSISSSRPFLFYAMAESLALVRANLCYHSKPQTKGYTIVLLATSPFENPLPLAASGFEVIHIMKMVGALAEYVFDVFCIFGTVPLYYS